MELPNQAIKLEFNASDIKIEPEEGNSNETFETDDPLALHENEKDPKFEAFSSDDETEYPPKKKPKKSPRKPIPKLVTIQSQKSIVIHNSDPRNDEVKKSQNLSIVIHNTKKRPRNVHVCVCMVCGREFRDNYNYQRHLKTHTNEKTYECEVCTKQFTEMQKLQYHWFTHTAEKIWQCGVCQQHYMSRASLRKHCSTMHTDIPNVEDLIVKNEFNSAAMTCKECFEVINGFPALIQHYNSQHPELKETEHVDFNGDPLELKSKLERFMVTNKKEKLFQCDLCLKTFADKKNVEPHLYSHTGERLFGCDLCSYSVDTMMKLKYHYEARHPYVTIPRDKQFIKAFYTKVFLCPFCSIQIGGLIDTLEHFKTHHLKDLRFKDKEDKFMIKCDLCECSYSTKGALTRHMKSKHLEQFEESGHYSSQKFEVSLNDTGSDPLLHPDLIENNETMESSEMYQTEYADIDTKLPSETNLQNHQLIRHEDKNIDPLLDSREIELSKTSNKHISLVEIDSDDEPSNQCLFCGQGFKKLSLLTSHLRNCESAKSNCDEDKGPTFEESSDHSKLLPNQCLFCKQPFERLPLLITHLRTCEQAKGS